MPGIEPPELPVLVQSLCVLTASFEVPGAAEPVERVQAIRAFEYSVDAIEQVDQAEHILPVMSEDGFQPGSRTTQPGEVAARDERTR
jgi:hypothetical protein